MERVQYDEMRKTQEVHWWFCGKRKIVLGMYDYFCKKEANQTILDVGCGMGLMLKSLSERGEVYGMDMEPDAVNYCKELFEKQYSEEHIQEGFLPYNIPFDRKFDAIIALDVLEHINDDEEAIRSIYSKLEDDGTFIATVPALMSMWSGNDELNHHYRRYEKRELKEKIEKAGFVIDKLSFYNSKLFLPAYTIRFFKNLFHIHSSDIGEKWTPGISNEFFKAIFSSEEKWLKKHNYGIGVSLILIARKK